MSIRGSVHPFFWWLFWFVVAILLIILAAVIVHLLGGFCLTFQVGHFHLHIGVT